MIDWTVRTASLRAQLVGDVYVFVHTSASPTDDEWERVLALFRQRARLEGMKLFVQTLGGAPNAAQRAKLTMMLGAAKLRVAIVTHSAVARAAGTALAWFNASFRVFGPAEVTEAFDHLDLGTPERSTILKAVSAFSAELKSATSPHTRA